MVKHCRRRPVTMDDTHSLGATTHWILVCEAEVQLGVPLQIGLVGPYRSCDSDEHTYLINFGV